MVLARSRESWMRALLNVVPMFLTLLEPRLYQTHSLRTFWAMLIPWPTGALALYIVRRNSSFRVGCDLRWRSHASIFAALLQHSCWARCFSRPLSRSMIS